MFSLLIQKKLRLPDSKDGRNAMKKRGITRDEKARESRTCSECDKLYKKKRGGSYKYCSDECKDVVRKRHSRKCSKIYQDRIRLASDNDIEWLVMFRINRIKLGAKKRGLVFDLTYEFVSKFFKADCHYCGEKLHIVSLDRVESSIGYITSNVVPCCTWCNRMKLANDKEDFIAKCKAIASRF